MVPEGGRELGGKMAFRLCTNGVVVSPEDRGTGRDALLDGAGGGVLGAGDGAGHSVLGGLSGIGRAAEASGALCLDCSDGTKGGLCQ